MTTCSQPQIATMIATRIASVPTTENIATYFVATNIYPVRLEVVGPDRFELSTYGLRVRCSTS